MIWSDMDLAFFDVESTGRDPRTARIVTACVGRVDGSQVTSHTWLANPGCEIPDEAAAIHGVTTEQAREHGRPHDDVVSEIADEIRAVWAEGRVLCAYNAVYDLTVMHTQTAGRFTVDGPVCDPYVLDRGLDTYRRGSRKLDAVCDHYGITLGKAHDAEADAVAAARLAWKMPRRFPILTLIGPDELMAKQAVMHRERQLDFIQHLKRQGKPTDDVNTSWPLAA
ncbi:exonuclease domain-containing protein [Prescottella equi]|uniref:exonuclease domain-containing protein n=1 Tax=Rhodococcus hoagii TaxID=43767 RepID=UPI001EEC785F|nr:exonuclease domain-containing protein [Prescottella equi]